MKRSAVRLAFVLIGHRPLAQGTQYWRGFQPIRAPLRRGPVDRTYPKIYWAKIYLTKIYLAGAGGGRAVIVAGSQCSSALPSTKRQVSNHDVLYFLPGLFGLSVSAVAVSTVT